MTESSTQAPEAESTTEVDDDTAAAPGDDGVLGSAAPSTVVEYGYWAAFGLLLLLGFYATVQAYLSATRVIEIWIAPEYRPLFKTAFNLGVVLACAIAISLLIRRLR